MGWDLGCQFGRGLALALDGSQLIYGVPKIMFFRHFSLNQFDGYREVDGFTSNFLKTILLMEF